MVILVIGATGNVGGAALRELARAGAPVRALSRNPDRVPPLGPSVEAVHGDVERPETIAAALAGVDRVLLCANAGDLPAREAEVMALAEDAGVAHLVLLSSLGVAYNAGSGPEHAPSERRLQASPSLAWTILRPIAFMSNALRWARSITATGAFEEPTGEGRQAMIHPADIGAVAAVALTTPGHEGRTYDLTGPESLTSAQYAHTLSVVLGRPVRHADIAEDAYRAQFTRYGAPPALIDSILAYFALVRTGRLDMVTPDVEALLGRPARSFHDWATQYATAFAG